MTENNTHSTTVFTGHSRATFPSSAVRSLSRWPNPIKKKIAVNAVDYSYPEYFILN